MFQFPNDISLFREAPFNISRREVLIRKMNILFMIQAGHDMPAFSVIFIAARNCYRYHSLWTQFIAKIVWTRGVFFAMKTLLSSYLFCCYLEPWQLQTFKIQVLRCEEYCLGGVRVHVWTFSSTCEWNHRIQHINIQFIKRISFSPSAKTRLLFLRTDSCKRPRVSSIQLSWKAPYFFEQFRRSSCSGAS